MTQSQLDQLYALWRKLTYELTGIFDAHGVCAIVAGEIAAHTRTRTVVGVQDPQHKYFDVWICDAKGILTQTRWSNKKASFAPLIEAGKALRTPKFSRPPDELINSELWQLPQKAIHSVPLPFSGGDNPMTNTPPGVLCLLDPEDDCCLTLESLEPLAINVTTFLDRAYMRLQLDRQTIEFDVVSDINYALTSKLSLQNIFSQLMDQVRRTINVESVSMGLIDPTTGDIEFEAVLMGPLFKDLPPVRLRKGQGIAGWVAERGEVVVINDVYADERFYVQVDRQSGFQTRSMICVPLKVEERMIGVLQAINKQEGQFSQHDLSLLQAITGPLAAAIENANLHNDVIAEKRRVETILGSMAEGLLTVTAQGVITQANEAVLTLLTLPYETVDVLVGQPVADVVRLRKMDLRPFLSRILTAEDEYPQLAADLLTHDGSGEYVPVLLSGAPIPGDDGVVHELILMLSDLRQIREVERMRDDFFHGIVHELRTPLATILMYARMLRGGKASNQEKADRFLGVIERESDRLQKMVRQMLQLAKQEARELQRSSELVALNPIFEEMMPPLTDRALEKGLLFRQKIQPDLPMVLGNQETYYLIFKNLVDNAIKFTLSGTVSVTVQEENGRIMARIKDQGIGIPRQALPNLFKRFYRTQTAVERGIAGTGLGLYMVKESVENFNGQISVESEEGVGTTFIVSLPTAEN
ncbi:MAG: GAF domain-containing protein [Ardenticatenaceae bacterium]|nr:GAF domain-containing protein [Ardenticatenaceae bacterium]MCB9002948.1 GAF domain-containing protein [Ardenticatenaceae bacterium]